MGDVVNLNRFRKKKLREADARSAEANRAKHGRTKAERAKVDKIHELDVRRHEGNKLDRDDPEQ